MVARTMASAPNAQTRSKFSLTKPVAAVEQQSKVQDFGVEGTKRRDFAVNGEQQPKMSSSSPSSIKKLDCNRLRLRVEEPKDSPPKQECCMCGDVGFSTELFRCGKCLYRHQHTYCSRFYPSICDLDVCDWCSQGESNPSGSNSKQRGATKSSSKRKLEAPAAAAPNARRSSNCSQWGGQYTDALELLLEVAQTVADGKQTDGPGHEEQQQLKKQEQQQQQQQHQQLKKQEQEQQVEVFSSPKGKVGGGLELTKRQSCEGDGRSSSSRLGQFPKSSSSNKLQQLSTSRSMGRRYKLLSDVLC